MEAGQVVVAEAELDERTYQGQPSLVEAFAQDLGVTEIAERAELRARVACGCDRIEDLLGPGHVREHADGQLERAVADGCVGDPDHRTSGTRGSGSRSAHDARIQASSGSSAAAIERRSPAQ